MLVSTLPTNATIDLEMKGQAITKAKPLGDETNPQSSWREKPDILNGWSHYEPPLKYKVERFATKPFY